jgi:hypothetical protein
MKNSTLHDHLLRSQRSRREPLDIMIMHDGFRARRRVEGLLQRIREQLGADLQMDCAYQRIAAYPRPMTMTTSAQIKLVFLATSCSAKLPPKVLSDVTSLLPSLKANHGALAFLSGTNVPRQTDVVLVEQFLRTHSERIGVAFFSGCMPGLGCPGCGTPKREKSERSEPKHLCVLHAPRNVRSSTHPAASKKSKPTKLKTQPARPARPGNPARVAAKRQLRHGRPGQKARS